MTARYNPHRIEKQAREWPVLSSARTLAEDIHMRFAMIWNRQRHVWTDPFVTTVINTELLKEYGSDTARIAQISAQGGAEVESLLESSFKWLARLNMLFNTCESNDFSEVPWLEAILQSHDQVVIRNRIYCGFSRIRRALRLSPPGKNLSSLQKHLVITAVYPFCPLWARFNLSPESGMPVSAPELIEGFSQYLCIRLALPAGGWHWCVFSRERFEKDPASELLKLKWVSKATGAGKIRLAPDTEGVRICIF